jgi:hypothetical protein
MLQPNLTPAMTIDTLRQSPVWKRLSPQQQVLLVEYLSAGLAQGNYDIAAAERAVKIAYPKVRDKRVWTSRMGKNPRIRAVLAFYFGDSELTVTLKEIQLLIRRTKRKGAPLVTLLAPWLRVAEKLEALAKNSE